MCTFARVGAAAPQNVASVPKETLVTSKITWPIALGVQAAPWVEILAHVGRATSAQRDVAPEQNCPYEQTSGGGVAVEQARPISQKPVAKLQTPPAAHEPTAQRAMHTPLSQTCMVLHA